MCKELTKRYESARQMTVDEAAAYYKENEPKGEYVLVLEGVSQHELDAALRRSWEAMSIEEHMALYENQGMGHKEAMKAVAADRGISKRDVYQYLVEHK